MPDLQGIETVFCKVFFGKCMCQVGAVYNSPKAGSHFISTFYDYISYNIRVDTHIILAGDFNLPNLNGPHSNA